MCIIVARSKVLTFVEIYAIVGHVLWWLHFKSLSLVLNVRAWALRVKSYSPHTIDNIDSGGIQWRAPAFCEGEAKQGKDSCKGV